jgi:excisionase family DNA binding protein
MASKKPSSPKLINTAQAAKQLKISPTRVRVLIDEGRLPASKVGRDYIINAADLKLVRVRKTGRPPKTND